MRTDVKIGVAVGLLLVIAVVVYYAVFGDAGPGDPNEPAEGTGSPVARGEGDGDGSDVALPRFGGLSDDEPPATPEPEPEPAPVLPEPSTPEPVVTPAVPEPPVTPEPVITPEAPEPVVTPAVPEPEPEPEPEPVVTPVMPRIRETPVPEPEPEPEPAVTPVLPRIRETPAPSLTPEITPSPPPSTPTTPVIEGAGGRKTYVVQKGDAGFWAVAQNVYGDGRLWPLIAKANPNASSSSLKPGQKLAIPPKPVGRDADAGGSTAAGGLATDAAGRRTYVVKKGDAGFWGISESVYGNGKYWSLLAKANPDVNSSALKPGQRLVVPEKPDAATPSTPAATAPVPTAAEGGTYTVTSGDTTGFWGIAKKVYGNGMYWPVIAKANPAVNSTGLKVGQKLTVPKLTAEMRREARTAPAAGRSTPAPATPPGDYEDIGPTPTFD